MTGVSRQRLCQFEMDLLCAPAPSDAARFSASISIVGLAAARSQRRSARWMRTSAGLRPRGHIERGRSGSQSAGADIAFDRPQARPGSCRSELLCVIERETNSYWARKFRERFCTARRGEAIGKQLHQRLDRAIDATGDPDRFTSVHDRIHSLARNSLLGAEPHPARHFRNDQTRARDIVEFGIGKSRTQGADVDAASRVLQRQRLRET